MNFILTQCGAIEIKKFFLKKKNIFLKVVMSDRYESVDENRNSLTNECVKVTPKILNSLEGSDTNLHLQLYLEKSDELDIYEIGLLIGNNEEIDSFTLFAIYGNEKPIIRITPQSDLFMDIMIDLRAYSAQQFINHKDYQAKFLLPHAGHDTYGIVCFADSNAISNNTKGLALSTNNLESLKALFVPKEEIHKTWKKCLTESITFPKAEEIVQGIFYDGNQSIYLLSISNIDNNSAAFKNYEYDLKKNINKKIGDATLQRKAIGTNAYLSHYTQRYKNLEWDFFSADNAISTLVINETRYQFAGEPIQFPLGSLFFYNDYLGSIEGTAISLIERKLHGQKGDRIIKNKDFLLRSRKKPLLHIVQDKLYCLGKNANDEPFVEIHTLYFNKDKEIESLRFEPKVYTPPELKASEDIMDIDKVSTCVHGNWIYLFKSAAHYDTFLNKESVFYRYHTLSHQFQTLPFPEEELIQDKLGKEKYISVVSATNAIYLFLMQNKDDSKTEFELNILKYTHGT